MLMHAALSQVFTQRFAARREALDEAGRTVSELEAMLHDARTLRTQVYAFAALRYY